MPIIPEPSEFPSIVQKEGKEATNKQGDQPKASAMDHISKGPQIPDGELHYFLGLPLHLFLQWTNILVEMPPKASREEIEARMKELNKPKSN